MIEGLPELVAERLLRFRITGKRIKLTDSHDVFRIYRLSLGIDILDQNALVGLDTDDGRCRTFWLRGRRRLTVSMKI